MYNFLYLICFSYIYIEFRDKIFDCRFLSRRLS